MMSRLAQQHLPQGFTLRSITARQGVPMIINDAELRTAEEEVVTLGREQAASVDAIIIAGFGDPGATRLRTHVTIPVIGIGEASLHAGSKSGRHFGIATTTPALQQSITAYVEKLGLSAQCTGVHIPDCDPRGISANADLQEALLADATAACIADGAEAVIIGGGPLAESAVRLAQRFSVPIISPVAAAIEEICRHLQSIQTTTVSTT